MATPVPSKVLTGGRSVVSIVDQFGNINVIGIFDSCSVSESLTAEEIHILGAYAPPEITVTSYNAVRVQCSGFRVYGFGVKALGKFPTLNQLLGLGPVTIVVGDRQNPNGAPMATVVGCIPDSNSNNFQTRATSKINVSYMGTYMADESAPTDSEAGAVTLP